jgi:hypothetical protein
VLPVADSLVPLSVSGVTDADARERIDRMAERLVKIFVDTPCLSDPAFRIRNRYFCLWFIFEVPGLALFDSSICLLSAVSQEHTFSYSKQAHG